MTKVWKEVEFEAFINLENFNIGGNGGFDFTNATATVRGTRIIDIFHDGNIKSRMKEILGSNGVDLIDLRILKVEKN